LISPHGKVGLQLQQYAIKIQGAALKNDPTPKM